MAGQDQEGMELATSGASGVSRGIENGKLLVRYQMIVHRAATGKLNATFSCPINAAEPIQTTSGASIGKNGVVVCPGRTADHCSGIN